MQDQVSAIDNGLYRITVVGDAVSAQQTLVRDTEYDATADAVLGKLFWVEEGTVNADTIAHISTSPAVLDTNDFAFTAGTYASITITLPAVAEAKGKIYSILAMAATPVLTVTVADGDDSEEWGGDHVFVAAGHSGLFYSDGIKWTALFGGVGVLSVKTVLTSAQILLLAGSPITLVPALGATKLIEFISATLLLTYGSNVFTENVDNLVIGYTDESGVAVSVAIETTGFIDQSADTVTRGIPVLDAIVADADSTGEALVIYNNNANFGGNAGDDNTITVWTLFRVIETG